MNDQVTVLNNAVNVQDFQYNEELRCQARAELGVGDKLLLGHIGRFNKQKNHDFVIDIFQEVHEKQPESMLVLVGDGPLRASVEKKAARLGLSEHVKFLGVRADIPRLMQGMDLFLFPSLFEGLPVVLVEAQAAGLKCVVSDAITRETDVTGRVDFISLKEPPSVWADNIIASSFEHEDTSEQLRNNGLIRPPWRNVGAILHPQFFSRRWELNQVEDYLWLLC
ncbi:glycosyltransferase [Cohnella kolymensis]|uniref:glycosyltransferase n=1 Tax=Cohnella kolymensis TaxID=1590652 RepID=UPI000A938191|nr:glycosyltransferase [Cohnella kolymensis]